MQDLAGDAADWAIFALVFGTLLFIALMASVLVSLRDAVRKMADNLGAIRYVLEKQAAQSHGTVAASHQAGPAYAVDAPQQPVPAPLRPREVPLLSPEQIAPNLCNPPRIGGHKAEKAE